MTFISSDKTILQILHHIKEPIALFDVDTFHIRFVNAAMLSVWNKSNSVIGKDLLDVLPEFPFFGPILKDVWRNGINSLAQGIPIQTTISGSLEIVYSDFEFRPILEEDGTCSAVICTAGISAASVNTEVKELAPLILNEHLLATNIKLQESNRQLSLINQQYQETIEELNVLNEEYSALNESLNARNEEVRAAYREVERIESKMRLAIEAANLGTWHIQPKDKSLTYNEKLASIFGYEGATPMTYDQAIGQVLEEHRPFVKQAIESAIAKGGNYEFNYQQKRFNDGKIIWLKSRGKIIEDEDKMSTLFCGIVIDITDQMTAQKALEESEERFRSLAEGSEMMISVTDVDGNVEYINQAWLNLVGKDALEMMDYRWADFLFPEEKEKTMVGFIEGIKSRKSFATEFRIRDKNNAPRWIYSKINPRYLKDGSFVGTISTSVEITEMLQHQDLLQEANIRLNIALEAGGFGSTEVDLSTGRMIANDQFKKCYGRDAKDDFSYTQLFEAMLPQYRDEVKHLVSVAKENRSVYRAEYQVTWPDGTIHWISAHGRARYDSKGEPVKMVGIVSDITESKQDEQRKNDFIGMVSHELKTPLTSVSGYLQILHIRAIKREDAFDLNALTKTTIQIKKMTTMINGFLDVSKLNSGKIYLDKKLFDLALLLNEVKDEVLTTTTSHNIIFEHVESITIYADREKIAQVIHNLITNAIKYSPMQTNITIDCKIVKENVRICVKDEGMGIKPEDETRLFERFYRVVNHNMANIPGFGIGLYLCSEIIKQHNGKIWVESELGKGSSFFFSLLISRLAFKD